MLPNVTSFPEIFPSILWPTFSAYIINLKMKQKQFNCNKNNKKTLLLVLRVFSLRSDVVTVFVKIFQVLLPTKVCIKSTSREEHFYLKKLTTKIQKLNFAFFLNAN